MVWYLLRDLLRRNRVMYAWMAPVAIVMWVAPTNDGGETRLTLTASMFIAVALGPFMSMATIGIREIRLLPVRFSDLWTLTWVASTVVPSCFVAAAASLAMLTTTLAEHPAIGIDTVGLMALYNFIYTNLVLMMLPALNYVSKNMRPGATTTAATISITAGVIGAFGLPWFFAPWLPTLMTQVTAPFAALLLTGVAASFGVLMWRPRLGVATGLPAQNRVRPGTPAKRRVMDKVTGIARVLVPYLATAAALTLVAAGGNAWYASTRGVAAFVDEGMSGMAYMLIGMTSPWMPWARLLKSLPLRAGTINAWLVSTPGLTWLVMAGTLLALEPWLGPTVPAWFTPGVLVCFAGMSAVLNALAFRNQGVIGWIVGPGAATSPFVGSIARYWMDPSSPWFVVAGLAALGLAAWINQRTLTRCGSASRAFRRHLMAPFGISVRGAPR
jgi:hypothetical protein